MGRNLLLYGAVVVAILGLLAWARPGAVPDITRPGGDSAGPDMRITLSERRLAEQMSAALAGDDRYQDPVLDLLPSGRARLAATLPISFLGQQLAVRPSMDLRLAVVDGRVTALPEGMELEGIPLPARVVEAPMNEVSSLVEEQLNAAVGQISGATGLKLSSLTTTDDSLVLDFGR